MTPNLITKIFKIADGDSVKAEQILDLVLEERREAIKGYQSEGEL
jgi:hypothetical protein